VSAWCEAGAGLLNRNTLRIDTSTASTIDGYTLNFDKWIPLDGANEVIDISTLPVIEVPAAAPAPLAPPVPAVTWDDPALKQYRTEEVAAICKQQQDASDANARAIGKKNLQRELEREKRLGVGYAYDAE
jgi:hypothetical protein